MDGWIDRCHMLFNRLFDIFQLDDALDETTEIELWEMNFITDILT